MIYGIQKPILAQTASPLGASAVWTSDVQDVSTLKSINLRVVSDQACTVLVQQSDDGTNWDTLDTINVAAGTPTFKTETAYLPKVQFKITNGTTVQTYLRASFYGVAL